jgi:eukaryotic-like serine/threonine-protein kinase
VSFSERLGDATMLARAALGFCGPHRFELDVVLPRPAAGLLRRALAALDDDDSALRARVMGRLGAALAYTDVERGTPMLARQALQMARRIGDRATLADVLASTLWAIRGPDSLKESLALAGELRVVAAEVGDDTSRVLAHVRRLDLLLELGDIDAVDCELEALQLLARTRRERYFTWFLPVLRVGRALLEGRLADCESLARDALAHCYEGNDQAAARAFEAQMLFIRHEQGRFDELVQAVTDLADEDPRNVSWRCVRVLGYVQLGQTARAGHELEELARDEFGDIPRDEIWMASLSALSGVAYVLGDSSHAQRLYTLLLPYADRCVVTGALLCAGSVSRLLGLLATALSRYEDAARHFEQALETNTRIRSPLWIGHTQVGYAHMLLLRNRPGDRDKALQLLEKALTTAEELGLTALGEGARRLELATESAGPRAAVAGLA